MTTFETITIASILIALAVSIFALRNHFSKPNREWREVKRAAKGKWIAAGFALIFSASVAHAGPECKTYGLYTEMGDHLQIQFDCHLAGGFLGLLNLIYNDEAAIQRAYLTYVDPDTGETIVIIPPVIRLVCRDHELILQGFDMTFSEE